MSASSAGFSPRHLVGVSCMRLSGSRMKQYVLLNMRLMYARWSN